MANKKFSQFANRAAAQQAADETFFVGYDPTLPASTANIRMTAEEMKALLGVGSLAIGEAVGGGTANRVLYVDSSGNLADSANLTFSGTQLGLANGTAAAPSLKIGAAESGLFRSTGTGIERLQAGVAGTEVLRLYRDTVADVNRVGFNLSADPLAAFHLRGNGSATGEMLRLEDGAGVLRFLLLDNGNIDSRGIVNMTDLILEKPASGSLGVFTYPNSGTKETPSVGFGGFGYFGVGGWDGSAFSRKRRGGFRVRPSSPWSGSNNGTTLQYETTRDGTISTNVSFRAYDSRQLGVETQGSLISVLEHSPEASLFVYGSAGENLFYAGVNDNGDLRDKFKVTPSGVVEITEETSGSSAPANTLKISQKESFPKFENEQGDIVHLVPQTGVHDLEDSAVLLDVITRSNVHSQYLRNLGLIRETTILQDFQIANGLVSAYGNEILTTEGYKVGTWTDLVGDNDLIEGTDNEKPVFRVAGKFRTLQFDEHQDVAKGIGISTNPFTAITNGTIIFVFRIVDNQYIILNQGAPGAFAFAAFQGNSSSGVDQNFGAPNYYVNGTLESWANRGEVYSGIPQGEFVVVSAVGVDLSSWGGFILGQVFGSTSTIGFYPNMQMAAMAVYDNALGASDREKVEAALMAKFNGAQIETYSFASETTVVPDQVGGQNAANTGIDYDAQSDEIIIAEFVQTFASNLLFLNGSTLAGIETVDINSHVTQIQGVAVDNRDVNDRRYFVNGTPQTGDGALHEFKRDGSLVARYDVSMAGASLDFDAGFLFYYDQANTQIIRYRAKNGILTLVETKQVYPRISSGIEGLHVKYAEYYVLNEAGVTRKYRWSDNAIIAEITTGLTQVEGVTELASGAIAINDDKFFHEGVANGNKLHIYNKN